MSGRVANVRCWRSPGGHLPGCTSAQRTVSSRAAATAAPRSRVIRPPARPRSAAAADAAAAAAVKHHRAFVPRRRWSGARVAGSTAGESREPPRAAPSSSVIIEALLSIACDQPRRPTPFSQDRIRFAFSESTLQIVVAV